jgi:type III secretion protein T
MEPLFTIVKYYEAYLLALLIVGTRLYGFFTNTYILSSAISGRSVRGLLVAIFALPIAVILPQTQKIYILDINMFVVIVAVEFFKGYILGFSVGWIFWVMEAVGNIIDNQRGASIATAVNPLLGQEASPLGILFSQSITAYFYAIGGMFVFLNIFYASYIIWPAGAWLPRFDVNTTIIVLAIFQKAATLAFLLAAPMVVVMFVAEFALAMVSRFSPQIQVFILAMPIKSALVTFLLIFYFKSALDFTIIPLEKIYISANRGLPILGNDIWFDDVLNGGRRLQGE